MSVWAGFWSVDVALKMSVLTRWDWHWFYWAAAWQFPISTATFHHGLTGIRLSTWVQHSTCVRYSTTIKFPISVQEHSNTISRWVTRIAVHFFLCRVHLSQRFFLGEAYFCLRESRSFCWGFFGTCWRCQGFCSYDQRFSSGCGMLKWCLMYDVMAFERSTQ